MNLLQRKWDEIYQRADQNTRPQPAFVLKSYDYLLPREGLAVDLACGLGGNALYLAKQGLKTFAWDLSPVAVAHLNQIAEQEQLDLVSEVYDLETMEWPQQRFDVAVVTRFLDRELCKSIVHALRPEGLLYFQTFIRDKDTSIGPSSPEYLLAENELVGLFSGLVIRAYCETGQVGDVSKGFRNEAYLVGQKAQAL